MRFKSFPVQSDGHLLTVLRYVERNPLGAGLVTKAEDWRWRGVWARRNGEDAVEAILSPWPVDRLGDWIERVNASLGVKELGRLRTSIARGRPYGEDAWVKRMAIALNLGHILRPEGRPPKRDEPGAES